MPGENRSRSRKRKAVAAKTSSSDVSQSQSCSSGSREERYVPRFGLSSTSSTKRARRSCTLTGEATEAVSLSQPIPPHPPVAAPRDRRPSEKLPASVIEDTIIQSDTFQPIIKRDVKEDREMQEPENPSIAGSDEDRALNNDAVQENSDSKRNTGSQDIPGSSLTQSIPTQMGTKHPSPPPPPPPPPQPPTTDNDDRPREKNNHDKMNLDLLDPMGDEKENETIHYDETEDKEIPQEDIQLMNIHENTIPFNAHQEENSSIMAVVPVTEQPLLCQSPTNSEPPVTDTHANSTVISPKTKLYPGSPPESIYNNNDALGGKTDIQKMVERGGGEGGKGELCDDVKCICDSVEEAVVTGGSSGKLLVTNNPTTTTNTVESPEELLAVKEMMDLTARDLIESQLLPDEATVPSCSPAIPTTIREEREGGGVGGVGGVGEEGRVQARTPNAPSSVLHGLIEELSALNQYVLACKRELENHRRRREAWTRSYPSTWRR